MQRLLIILFFIASLGAEAYTDVDGFYGQTWLDYVDEDGFGGGNFGNGTESNPWQIRSAGALAYLAREVNNGNTYEGKYFIIAANIDLGYAPSGTKLVWVPIGCNTTPSSDSGNMFKGTMTNGTDANGKPYEITGMTIRAYGTATTNCFGLFGVLRGTVDGLVVKNSNIFVDQTTDTYYAGTIAGYLGKTYPVKVTERLGTIRNCTVEQTTIEAKSSDKRTCIGGLVGTSELDISELNSNLAKSSMRLDGPMRAGGVTGETYWEMCDCHAVVDITATNTSSDDAYLGGIAGYSYNLNSTYISSIKYCTSSGEIRGDGNNITLGGVLGYSENCLNMSACTTCVALSGGKIVGGLIGHCYSLKGAETTMIEQCYCNSYVDGSTATYAGGLFGYVDYNFRTDIYSITPLNNTQFTTFAGTMKKPSESEYYGTIVGYAPKYKNPAHYKFGYFQRDYRQCNLQTNSHGWVDDGDNLALATYFTPHPVNGDFRYDYNAEYPQIYLHSEGKELFYKDNMTLASIPFNVTNDGKSFFDLWDTTVDFQIGTFKNQSTSEEIATFTVPTPPACVEINDNTVKVLDPGEVDVIVNYHGLQRKVHLTITYGQPWDGSYLSQWDYTDYFAGGDGSASNPYVIHNVQELARVMQNYNSTYCQESYLYNKAGKHYILANDLFINTHLLGEDEQPKEDAREWYNFPWYATLHGNGKTIYGLYQKPTEVSSGKKIGLISTLEGTVTDLAIVDSYIGVNTTNSDVSAGLLCGLLDGGTVERCVVHGALQADGYAGGICGQASGDGSKISDCFSCVHVGWVSHASLFQGAGISYTSPDVVQRCVSTGKVESYNEVFGLTQNEASCTDCWFDRQMMSQDIQTFGYTYTKDMISGKILTNASAWRNADNRYPMLKQFADTPYGDLLSMAVRFDDNDRAGYITQIFEFPTENVRWWAKSGQQYLDVINECGAASPNGKTGSFTEYLLAESTNSKSECTKALRALAVNVRADKAGIKFQDRHAETAALTAFDNNDDGLVTLREAFEASTSQFAVFNNDATDAETFNEMRFFAGFNTLQENMISGLQKLREVTLPQTITTIATNTFNGCTSLEELELPHRFLTLEEGGFYGSGIKNLNVSEKNPNCRSIEGVLYLNDTYDDDKVMLMAYPPGRGEEDATLSVPLTSIMPYAIYKVPGLKNVYIDNCLPEGEMAELEEDGIIHEDEDDIMYVYVNDGSFNSQLFMDYYNDDMWGELYYDEDHLHIYYPLKVTSALWSTLYIDFPTQLPEGLKAYIADYPDEEGKIVELHSIGRIVPRSIPVAIKAEQAGLYPLYRYNGSVPDVNKWENRFIGSFIGQDGRFGVPTNQETSNEGNSLTLGRNKNGVVGFYKYTGTEIPPYRAYLTRNNIIEGVSMRMGVDYEDEATLIDNPDVGKGRADGTWYSIDGRRIVGKPSSPGIYIVNGKKIAIK